MRELIMKHWKWMLLALLVAGLGELGLFVFQPRATATIAYTLPKGVVYSRHIGEGYPYPFLLILESKRLRSLVERSYSETERRVLAEKPRSFAFVPWDDSVSVKIRREGSIVYYDIVAHQCTSAAAALVADRYATKFFIYLKECSNLGGGFARDFLRTRLRELTKELENATSRLAQSRAENNTEETRKAELEVSVADGKRRKIQERIMLNERPPEAPFTQVVFATKSLTK